MYFMVGQSWADLRSCPGKGLRNIQETGKSWASCFFLQGPVCSPAPSLFSPESPYLPAFLGVSCSWVKGAGKWHWGSPHCGICYKEMWTTRVTFMVGLQAK
jgi:hypothetical protein